LTGLLLSLYAVEIKRAASGDPDYVPQCDISEEVSCSKVMHSEYGNMLSLLGIVDEGSLWDQTNSLYGAGFYALSGLVSCVDSTTANKTLFLLSAASMAITVVLAYVMFFRIGAVCVVCLGTYAANTAFLVGAWLQLKR
ncbi:unnamed protein product, partial [Ectocarpus fasciculatus]